MANGHGGYRPPANPAPVSGPGAHSRRTDGQPTMDLPDAQYGENAAFRDAQSAAPISNSGVQSAANQGSPAPAIIGLGEPSQQPGIPVTDGAEYGDGAGADAIGGLPPGKMDAQYLAKYLPTLVDIAERDDTPPGFKRFVRTIIASS